VGFLRRAPMSDVATVVVGGGLLLRHLGYDVAQGFLLGRPGPLAAIRPSVSIEEAAVRSG
jgi:hypothetical protein